METSFTFVPPILFRLSSPPRINSQAHYTKGKPLSLLYSETDCQSLRFTEALMGYAISLPFLHSTSTLSITDFGGPFGAGLPHLHAEYTTLLFSYVISNSTGL